MTDAQSAEARYRLAARRSALLAVKHGQEAMVRLLLDLGADADERTMLDELEEPTESAASPYGWRRGPGGGISPNCCSTAAPTRTPIRTRLAGRSTMPIAAGTPR